jgi:hypothetical protein
MHSSAFESQLGVPEEDCLTSDSTLAGEQIRKPETESPWNSDAL